MRMAFFELRQYRIKPGHHDDWIKLMEEEILPFQTSKGMVIVGSWWDEQDPEHYIWMRRFESEEERERQYEAVYQSDRWKNDISDRVGEIMDRSQIKVTRIEPTRMSVLR
jgi:hypothetical protein